MKTKELIELLKQSDPEGNYEVVVPVFVGCGGPCVIVTGCGRGIDWYTNKLCLNTNEAIVTFSNYKYREDEYNNYNKIIYCKIGDRREKLVMSNSRKPKKIDRIIKARYVGEKGTWMKIKITKIIDMKLSFLPHPQYEGEIICDH